MNRFAPLGFAVALLPMAAYIDIARAQTGHAPGEASTAVFKWSPVDYNFVAQANLGAPFQIASGRIAEEKATTSDIRDYARLMVVTHIPVVDALNAVLQQQQVTAPPNTLLQSAYDAMIASLNAEKGAALDRDYVEGQVEYQKGNAALFRYEIENGTDPDLRGFAQRTLPKIEDHLQRALNLAKGERPVGASTE
jgi:putative membrane protein